MKILMLSATFPYPPSKGGTQVRTFHLAEYLSDRHEVTLVTLRSPDVTDDEVAALGRSVGELVVFERSPEPAGGLVNKLDRAWEFVRTGVPPSVRAAHSAPMQAWVDRAIAAGQFDVVTCEHSVNEQYLRPEWIQGPAPAHGPHGPLRTIVNIHSSVYGTCRNQLATGTAEKPLRDRLNQPLLKRYERTYCQKFSALVVTTEEDAVQMRQFAPDRPVAVIPNGVNFETFPMRSRDPGGHNLIFCGAMDNQPNIDAVTYLAQEIFPMVRSRYPAATLTLVGARPGPAIQALGNLPGVTVTGSVPAMAPHLHQATIAVIPMRTGFGIKNKTLEAMAAGVPVVGSDRALEGLSPDGNTDERLNEIALRANDTDAYIRAITQLFEDPDHRDRLSRQGRTLVEQHYTWGGVGQRYEAVLAGPPQGA
jgi:glycosyltransferase involved in cell wall biosynthesis